MPIIAVHIVFFWVLSLTMHAKVVDHTTQKQETIQNVRTNQVPNPKN